jgi:hypothetical protein
MATTGLLDPLPLTGAGSKGVVISGDAWDAMVSRINLACSPSLNPTSGAGSFYVSKGGIILDVSPLYDLISNAIARLDSANATANCVGNTVTNTFTI